MINFNEIPYDWRLPGTLVEVRPNYQNVGVLPIPTRVLLAVQKLAAGTAVVGQRYEITRAEDGTALFGAGSIGQQVARAFKKANRTNQVYAIALADAGGGVKAVGTVTFTGAGTGTVAIWIMDRRVRFKVTSTMTVTQVAAAALAAVNADPDMPVVATAAAGVLTLTAKHAGESGNQIDVRLRKYDEDRLPGTLAAAVVAMTGGSGNPTMQTILDAVAADWYTDIVMPWDDDANLAALSSALADKYTALGKKDAHAYVGTRGTYGEVSTKGGLTNSPFITMIGHKKAYGAPWEWAANAAGIAAFQLTNDPARQLRSLVLPGISAPDPEDCYLDTERELLLRAGISTWTRLSDGSVVLERVITTYKVSNLGVNDTAWLDIMIPKTMTRIRYDWATYVTLLYPRHKLADDDSVAANNNDAVVTPKRMHGSWGSRCKLYERQGWIEDAKRTVGESVFERDGTDRNRLNARQQVVVIGNLMVLAAALEFQV